MRYIECPQNYYGKDRSLFLAGGITNCQNWQSILVKLLKNENLVLLNPRRKKYPEDNPNIDEEQIIWEYKHLKLTSAVAFWFPSETLCPITLYELGKMSITSKSLFIGVDPRYERINDIKIQTKLVRPKIEIVYSLEDLAEQIKKTL